MTHHFAVYDTTTRQILMIVTDAPDKDEATYNIPGSAKVPISIVTYKLLYPNIQAILDYVAGLLP